MYARTLVCAKNFYSSYKKNIGKNLFVSAVPSIFARPKCCSTTRTQGLPHILSEYLLPVKRLIL